MVPFRYNSSSSTALRKKKGTVIALVATALYIYRNKFLEVFGSGQRNVFLR